MPILDVEIITSESLDGGLAARIADMAAQVFGSPPPVLGSGTITATGTVRRKRDSVPGGVAFGVRHYSQGTATDRPGAGGRGARPDGGRRASLRAATRERSPSLRAGRPWQDCLRREVEDIDEHGACRGLEKLFSMVTDYHFDKTKIPKGMSFPLKRSRLDAALIESDVSGIHCVYFWLRQSGCMVLRGDFCGEHQRE